MALDPKVKSKWVRALRSGKYRRGRNQLKDDGKYCCLGVLCEVMGYPYEPDATTLEPSWREGIGLSSVAEAALIDLNDGGWDDSDSGHFGEAPRGYHAEKGTSFRVIADWISKHG